MESAPVLKEKRKTVRWVLLFILASLVLVYVNHTFGAKARRLESRIRGLQSELSQYAQTGREVRDIKKKIDTVKTKLEILKLLEAQQKPAVQRFFDILNTRPNNAVEITELTRKPFGMIIAGRAHDYEVLAGYADALRSHSWIGDVTFSSDIHSTSSQGDTLSFQIELQEKRPKSAGPFATPKKKRKKARK